MDAAERKKRLATLEGQLKRKRWHFDATMDAPEFGGRFEEYWELQYEEEKAAPRYSTACALRRGAAPLPAPGGAPAKGEQGVERL